MNHKKGIKMLKIEGIIEKNEIGEKFVVYELRDGITSELIFIGYCRITHFFAFPDARQILGKQFPERFIFRSISECTGKGEAIRQHAFHVNVNGFAKKLAEYNISNFNGSIICDQTGETFRTIGQVVLSHGIAAGNLSNHLRGIPGFNTVKGKTYRRVK